MKSSKDAKILLAHGGGGRLSDELIHELILPRLGNEVLSKLGDSAVLNLPGKSICFTTDSYVVKPLFFNGGDIGKLAVCGTLNDLAVAGAEPLAISLSLIIEEGLEVKVLDELLSSISRAAEENDVCVVTGDTKTVESGSADKIFINTAGIGQMLPGIELGMHKIRPGDKILINGTIGDHGMTIISQREGIQLESQLYSDCAAVAPLALKLLQNSDGIRFMRDPTRGGLAATLNEISRGTGLDVEIYEVDIPVKLVVQAAADMLGLDILTIANEGKFVAVVSPDSAEQCLDICRSEPLGKDAAIIGRVKESRDVPVVELVTKIGGTRIVQMPYGRELPRIC